MTELSYVQKFFDFFFFFCKNLAPLFLDSSFPPSPFFFWFSFPPFFFFPPPLFFCFSFSPLFLFPPPLFFCFSFPPRKISEGPTIRYCTLYLVELPTTLGTCTSQGLNPRPSLKRGTSTFQAFQLRWGLSHKNVGLSSFKARVFFLFFFVFFWEGEEGGASHILQPKKKKNSQGYSRGGKGREGQQCKLLDSLHTK